MRKYSKTCPQWENFFMCFHRGYLDKFVEYLVGDGPANRSKYFLHRFLQSHFLQGLPWSADNASRTMGWLSGRSSSMWRTGLNTFTYFRARHTPTTRTLFFRCCYCYYWNPARKQRPVAPRWHFEQGILIYNPTPARLPDAATLPQSGASSDTSDDDRYFF